jgi:hypothetical protein
VGDAAGELAIAFSLCARRSSPRCGVSRSGARRSAISSARDGSLVGARAAGARKIAAAIAAGRDAAQAAHQRQLATTTAAARAAARGSDAASARARGG